MLFAVVHIGRYEVLVYEPARMEWAAASHGVTPADRVPVEGGYEANGAELMYAHTIIGGQLCVGKAGRHLVSCRFLLI
jgi:hypothetical protein